MKHYTRTLTIAGSDSGGGAGIQADLKTFTVLNCYGMSVITALTAQNTVGVQAVHAIPTDFIKAQIDSVLEDIGVDAVKIGMLHDVGTITVVAERLQYYAVKKIVLDPVMIAKDDSQLLQDTAIASLKNLFPLITLLTPNIMEAEMLCQFAIYNRSDMQKAAKFLCQQGVAAVLVKGGHLSMESSSADCLYIKKTDVFHWLESPRINTMNTHGTGCTLSAAITAFLAKGNDLLTAVGCAKHYIVQAIDQGKNYMLGNGHGPVKHFINGDKNNANLSAIS